MVEQIGNYRIDGLVAEGGMARVYKARMLGAGGVQKVVALKCLKGVMQEDDNYVRMLMNEARITVRMTHKNIAQVYGLEHDGGQYFMVMELIDGVNLSHLIEYLSSLRRVFPVEAAVFIAMEVCSGLSYAHRLCDDDGRSFGIVHRDVNPQNICISKEGEVKLIDFGIAKNPEEHTVAGTIKGKFNYMSPEQARGDRVDQRTDVFALGAVLYEMLTGHMLYPLSLDDAQLRNHSRMADFIPIESYLPDIPETLKLIVSKALARDVNQRFATSRDFLLALTQFFHDSCKMYDSLNLSMLVEKYLKDMRAREDSKKTVEVRQQRVAAVDITDENAKTTVMAAPNMAEFSHNMAEFANNDSEECATSVYTKQDVEDAIRQGKLDASALSQILTNTDENASMISPALDRNVDLRVNRNDGSAATMICSMPVQRKRGFLQTTGGRLFIAIVVLAVICATCGVLLLSGKKAAQPDVVQQTTSTASQEIRIDSIPSQATVYFGDTDIGQTPTTMSHESGIREITLKKPFYVPHTVDIRKEIASGNTSLQVTLDPKKGTVEFDSDPQGADVFIDGKKVGVTPCEDKVPMDQFITIKLVKPGYREYKDTVQWNEKHDAMKDPRQLIEKKLEKDPNQAQAGDEASDKGK